MGYYLHITRAGEWVDSAEHPITAQEWCAFALTHPQLQPDPGCGPLDHVFLFLDGTEARLSWTGGHIQVRGAYTDSGQLARLAHQLHARLVGDEEEEYADDGTAEDWTEDRPAITPPGQ
jgi:hypothetical protein